MLSKTHPDEIQNYLTDTSHLPGGYADRVVFPENAKDVAAVLAEATADSTPVTISGAGTGTVGGRVPFGGIVITTERLKQFSVVNGQQSGELKAEVGRRKAEEEKEQPDAVRETSPSFYPSSFSLYPSETPFGRAQAGVMLRDYQQAADAAGLLYPPDPTEWSATMGGTVATNASGARTFKYGATRNYVRALEIVLATGEILHLRRGEVFAENGVLRLPLPSGKIIETKLPTYRMPQTRKHAAGYFITPEMDAIDLFIGSEGTLGVVTEIETGLLPKPENILSGLVFFNDETNLLAFVREARARSLDTRAENSNHPKSEIRNPKSFDARALEFFDAESLRILATRYDTLLPDAQGAIFFEQEITAENEDELMSEWLELLEAHDAMLDVSWFATNEKDLRAIREFRHTMPVLMNEWFARYRQKKVSTDMAVPDEHFPALLKFYQTSLRADDLRYVIFGHIGDNHVHVNILPRDDAEQQRARAIYKTFIEKAINFGGTISAEHGIGKLKRDYLKYLYPENFLREMAQLKRAFDPAGILGRGNIFAEEHLTVKRI